MLRVFASFLIALSLLAAPMQVLASQVGTHSGMVASAMNEPSGAAHHAAPAQTCASGECQTSLEQCAIACLSLPAALSGADGVSLMAPVNAHWSPERARLGAGQEPALPDQPPISHLL
jgi:hypothetical protein